MVYEKSAGAVVFKIVRGEPRYLLLQHPSTGPSTPSSGPRGSGQASDYWNFPKGLVEAGEDEVEAARREIREETGLADLEFLPGFRARDHYLFRRREMKPGHRGRFFTIKDVFFYLARAKRGRVKISWEHQGYGWLAYEEALKRLKYQGARKVLEKAHIFLKSKFSAKGGSVFGGKMQKSTHSTSLRVDPESYQKVKPK